jgi:hypothetical protein
MPINDSDRRDRRRTDCFSFDPLGDQRTGDEDRFPAVLLLVFRGLVGRLAS